jgi:hypothetical protein
MNTQLDITTPNRFNFCPQNMTQIKYEKLKMNDEIDPSESSTLTIRQSRSSSLTLYHHIPVALISRD